MTTPQSYEQVLKRAWSFARNKDFQKLSRSGPFPVNMKLADAADVLIKPESKTERAMIRMMSESGMVGDVRSYLTQFPSPTAWRTQVEKAVKGISERGSLQKKYWTEDTLPSEANVDKLTDMWFPIALKMAVGRTSPKAIDREKINVVDKEAAKLLARMDDRLITLGYEKKFVDSLDVFSVPKGIPDTISDEAAAIGVVTGVGAFELYENLPVGSVMLGLGSLLTLLAGQKAYQTQNTVNFLDGAFKVLYGFAMNVGDKDAFNSEQGATLLKLMQDPEFRESVRGLIARGYIYPRLIEALVMTDILVDPKNLSNIPEKTLNASNTTTSAEELQRKATVAGNSTPANFTQTNPNASRTNNDSTGAAPSFWSWFSSPTPAPTPDPPPGGEGDEGDEGDGGADEGDEGDGGADEGDEGGDGADEGDEGGGAGDGGPKERKRRKMNASGGGGAFRKDKAEFAAPPSVATVPGAASQYDPRYNTGLRELRPFLPIAGSSAFDLPMPDFQDSLKEHNLALFSRRSYGWPNGDGDTNPIVHDNDINDGIRFSGDLFPLPVIYNGGSLTTGVRTGGSYRPLEKWSGDDLLRAKMTGKYTSASRRATEMLQRSFERAVTPAAAASITSDVRWITADEMPRDPLDPSNISNNNPRDPSTWVQDHVYNRGFVPDIPPAAYESQSTQLGGGAMGTMRSVPIPPAVRANPDFNPFMNEYS